MMITRSQMFVELHCECRVFKNCLGFKLTLKKIAPIPGVLDWNDVKKSIITTICYRNTNDQ